MFFNICYSEAKNFHITWKVKQISELHNWKVICSKAKRMKLEFSYLWGAEGNYEGAKRKPLEAIIVFDNCGLRKKMDQRLRQLHSPLPQFFLAPP